MLTWLGYTSRQAKWELLGTEVLAPLHRSVTVMTLQGTVYLHRAYSRSQLLDRIDSVIYRKYSQYKGDCEAKKSAKILLPSNTVLGFLTVGDCRFV